MNYGRLVIAAVAGTVVDAVYGFLVYGTLIHSQFALFPGVYRPDDVGPSYMGYLFIGIFLAMLAAAYIYAKGYEGGSGAAEGARFGVAIGVFAVGYTAIVNFATLKIGRRFSVMMAAASFIEWILAGFVIGLVYKPTTMPRRAAAV